MLSEVLKQSFKIYRYELPIKLRIISIGTIQVQFKLITGDINGTWSQQSHTYR